jgi:hypothetical protein
MDQFTRRNLVGAATLRRFALVVAVGLIGSGALAATLDGYTALTYNSQGDKWGTDMLPLSKKYQIVAVQEVGNRPDKVLGTPKEGPKVSCSDALGTTDYQVLEYTWKNQRDNTHSYVYFLDSHRQRVNTAFVLQDQLKDFEKNTTIVCPQPDNTRNEKVGRPILGITMPNGALYFTMHAGSYGNNKYNDADNILNAVSGLFKKNDKKCWAILGDFNREPTQLTHVSKDQWVNSNEPTTPFSDAPRELDYMIARDKDCKGALVASIVGGRSADHAPVEFKIPTKM